MTGSWTGFEEKEPGNSTEYWRKYEPENCGYIIYMKIGSPAWCGTAMRPVCGAQRAGRIRCSNEEGSD